MARALGPCRVCAPASPLEEPSRLVKKEVRAKAKIFALTDRNIYMYIPT